MCTHFICDILLAKCTHMPIIEKKICTYYIKKIRTAKNTLNLYHLECFYLDNNKIIQCFFNLYLVLWFDYDKNYCL